MLRLSLFNTSFAYEISISRELNANAKKSQSIIEHYCLKIYKVLNTFHNLIEIPNTWSVIIVVCLLILFKLIID